MGKTIFNLFKNYYSQLQKLDSNVVTKSDTIAIEETNLKTSMFSNATAKFSGNSNNTTKRTDIFSIGDRIQVIELVESAPAILVHVAHAESQLFPCEVIWRSVIKHFVDTVTNEYLFIVDFFKSDIEEIFNAIFNKTITHLIQVMEAYVTSSYDMIGLLLTIKVAHSQRLIMQRRRIPIIDSFFDRLSLLLWPRFKSVFDINIKAYKDLNLKKIGNVSDLAPHFITRRYAEFVASVVLLQGSAAVMSTSNTNVHVDTLTNDTLGIGGGGELMLQQDLVQLRLEMISN